MKYIELFESLSPDRIEACGDFVSPDIQFTDPFNDICGIDAFKRLLYKTLNDVESATFNVTHQSKDKEVLFVRWEFSGVVKGLGDWDVVGMSEIHFDDLGRVVRHIDHWDASEQFYAKLPIIGFLLRQIRKRLQVS
ncbi:nuclear transport factor 2 family protein [Terasakiella sp. A23]|uniref:nuclear transport factor 2 family protein n=1 Tax=Terasakiella sp. FCG-A23 TaxID=3080561 RepID=UPI00295387C2|nr:nuclear transport factor 2 family protein [Terasakiella sp. A23]MDV7341273.1 nuclear transport factor 2 family protein [Terasakiella sp. A23]